LWCRILSPFWKRLWDCTRRRRCWTASPTLNFGSMRAVFQLSCWSEGHLRCSFCEILLAWRTAELRRACDTWLIFR
jgi:hypothetical protein